MEWIKGLLFKALRKTISEMFKSILDETVKSLCEEIDGNFDETSEREAFKSGIELLQARVQLAIRERL